MADEHCTTFTAPPGGVWTDEAGVVTGALELRTSCADDGAVTIAVRYQGADEWYAVRGGACALHDPADARILHDTLTAILDRPEG